MKHSVEFNIGRYRLTINFWFLIIFLIIQTVLNELGYWQISRAQEKQQIITKIEKDQNAPLYELSEVNQDDISNFRRIEANTEVTEKVNILIENKIQNGNLGYHVLNLVEDNLSGKVVLVNRGWISALSNRQNLPTVSLPRYNWSIKGRLYAINPQILSSDAELEDHGKIIRMPVLDVHMLALLEKQLGKKIEPYLIRLDESTEDVLDVDWAWVSMSPDKHLGYAFQWFGLALAFLIVSLVVLIKRVKD